eukprot:scaffold1295_cov220-Pinguiococcus_pyrenoidosus.AAC.10
MARIEQYRQRCRRMQASAGREAIFCTPLRIKVYFFEDVEPIPTTFNNSTIYLHVFSARHSTRRPQEAAGEARFAKRIENFNFRDLSVTNRSGAARNSGRRRGISGSKCFNPFSDV